MLPLTKALHPLKSTGLFISRPLSTARLPVALLQTISGRLVTTSSLLRARLPVPPTAPTEALPSFDDLSALFGRDPGSELDSAGQDLKTPHDLFFESPLTTSGERDGTGQLDSEYTRHVYFSRREQPTPNPLASSADLAHLFEESSLFDETAEVSGYKNRREDPGLLGTVQFEGLGEEANPPEIHEGGLTTCEV
jgi:hypothetical protein